MITREAIRFLMHKGLITVTPKPVKIGPNSIDLRLGESLRSYHPTENRVALIDPVSNRLYYAIDPKNPPPLVDVPKIPSQQHDGKYEDAWLLVPGQFYLGVTLEETFCKGVIPHLDGRSTCGRLSIEAHKTAGVGDNGFRGRWTLEIEATEPVLVRPGDRLFQIYFTPAWGEGVAIAISTMDKPSRTRSVTVTDDLYVSGGGILQPDAFDKEHGPLFNLHDLYGQEANGGGHHYQNSKDARGPSPLD